MQNTGVKKLGLLSDESLHGLKTGIKDVSVDKRNLFDAFPITSSQRQSVISSQNAMALDGENFVKE
jgi:hypothetical protein